jgi:hypothetical protein
VSMLFPGRLVQKRGLDGRASDKFRHEPRCRNRKLALARCAVPSKTA